MNHRRNRLEPLLMGYLLIAITCLSIGSLQSINWLKSIGSWMLALLMVLALIGVLIMLGSGRRK